MSTEHNLVIPRQCPHCESLLEEPHEIIVLKNGGSDAIAAYCAYCKRLVQKVEGCAQTVPGKLRSPKRVLGVKESEQKPKPKTPLKDLPISSRVYNALRYEGIEYLEELEEIPPEDFLKMRGIGYHARIEIERLLGSDHLSIPSPDTPLIKEVKELLEELKSSLKNIESLIYHRLKISP